MSGSLLTVAFSFAGGLSVSALLRPLACFVGLRVLLINVSRVLVSRLVVSVVVENLRLFVVALESKRVSSVVGGTAEVGRLLCCRIEADARRSAMLAARGC